MVLLRPFVPWKEPLLLLNRKFLGHLPGKVDLDYAVSLPPIHLLVVPSLYLLLWIAISARLQVILIESCSLNSCNFLFLWKEASSEFLLYGLGHTSLALPFYYTVCLLSLTLLRILRVYV